MCLAVPARLVEHDGQQGVADMHGNRIQVTTLLVPDVQVGDWILIHAGFAIQRIDAAAAQRTWSVLADAVDAAEGADR